VKSILSELILLVYYGIETREQTDALLRTGPTRPV